MRQSTLPLFAGLAILFFLHLTMIISLSPQILPRQLTAWVIGFGLFLLGRQLNPKNLAPQKNILFVFSCLLLLLPIIFNNITRGSRRWLDIGAGSFQPSEIVKPALMVFLSTTKFPLLHLLPVLIIVLQPDLGSAITVLSLFIPIVLYHRRLFLLTIAAASLGILFFPILWRFGLHDYQRHRLTTFLNPQSDPLGKGYNVIQSKIAIGSGGIFGRGFKKGTQSQLMFLPEKHTDFMFSATVEELGLVGAGLIILAYYLIVKTLLNLAYSATNNRALFLFSLGIAFQIWVQSFINIAMNLGLFPVTGIPLPFLSAGGSSIMSLLLSLGIVLSS